MPVEQFIHSIQECTETGVLNLQNCKIRLSNPVEHQKSVLPHM